MFWDLFDTNFRKVSCKPTDLNTLKIYLTEIESEIEANRHINERTIDEIFINIYEIILKKNASKNFLPWIEKKQKEVSKQISKL